MQAQGELSIQRMCELGQVSRASFYRRWESQEPGEAETALRDAIHRTAVQHRFYGYRRITVEVRKEGFVVGVKKVRRIMKQDNLLAVRRRKFVHTTDRDHPFRVYRNIAQYLELSAINQLWVADITYVRLLQEFVFLAVVLDAYSRKVIGWALGRRLDSRIAVQALDQAIATRHPQPGLVHHSDQGSQYASNEYVNRLQQIEAELSMSRAGRPWENGRCESFIKTLKQEEIDARPYRSYEELGQHIAEFIEKIYNPVRLHSALKYCSPVEFENRPPAGAIWVPAALSFSRHKEIYPDVS